MSRSTESRRGNGHALRRSLAATLAVVIALLGVLVAMPAQAATGDITGRLVDQYDNPVVGLDFTFYDSLADAYPVTSDPITGEFLVNVPADGYYYYNIDGALDDLGYGYVQQSDGASVVGTHDWGDIEIQRYENIAGTIDNFDAVSMLGVDISVEYRATPADFWVSTGYQITTTDGDFSVPAILDSGEYSLYFQLDPASRAPYLDAFLGGGLDEIADADIIHAIAGHPEIVSMTMPDAAPLSGTITTGGGTTPLSGIYVFAYQESGSGIHWDFTLTDSVGEYLLRARPGESYLVAAFDYSSDPDPYAFMIYDGFYGCGCQFTPVISTLLDPADGVDFDMTRESELILILGEIYDTDIDTGDPLEGVEIHVQTTTAGVWTDIAIAESNSFGEFQVVVPEDDIEYRLVFDDDGDVLRVVEGLVGPGSASSPDDAVAGCFLDTGEADPGWLDVGVLYYVVLGLNPAGGCGSTPPPSGTPGAQGGSGSVRYLADTVEARPTPTPTPTPTPRPSTSPAPEATDPEVPAPASAPDLWWLVWVGIAVLALILIGGAVIFIRRT